MEDIHQRWEKGKTRRNKLQDTDPPSQARYNSGTDMVGKMERGGGAGMDNGGLDDFLPGTKTPDRNNVVGIAWLPCGYHC